MPTYVYRREDGTTFEIFQRISDDALTADPETGQPVERVIGGGAGLIFKGSGFYQTDYVRKPNDSPTSSKESATTESPSETTASPSSEPKGSPDADA